jgi:hypothetical protein
MGGDFAGVLHQLEGSDQAAALVKLVTARCGPKRAKCSTSTAAPLPRDSNDRQTIPEVDGLTRPAWHANSRRRLRPGHRLGICAAIATRGCVPPEDLHRRRNRHHTIVPQSINGLVAFQLAVCGRVHLDDQQLAV